MEAERVRALGALCSFQSQRKLAAEKQRKMHVLSHEEKQKWMEDYVERETTVIRQGVDDPVAAIRQAQ
jgi:putative SOS response-associated peptidase YedK